MSCRINSIARAAVLILLAAALLWIFGPGNLASIAWSHRILAGTRSQAFPNIVLRDQIKGGREIAKAAIETVCRSRSFNLSRGANAPCTTWLRVESPGRMSSAGRGHWRLYSTADDHLMKAWSLMERTPSARAKITGHVEPPRGTGATTQYCLCTPGRVACSQGDYPAAIASFRQAAAADDQGDDAHMEKARVKGPGSVHGAGNTGDF